jgi:hypothetical protein
MNGNAAPLKREVVTFTTNGTVELSVPFAVAKVSFTVHGVGAALTAWDLDVDGRAWRSDYIDAVELDGHNNGVEAEGVVVNKDVTGVVTAIDVVMASLNLGSATAARVEIVMLGH